MLPRLDDISLASSRTTLRVPEIPIRTRLLAFTTAKVSAMSDLLWKGVSLTIHGAQLMMRSYCQSIDEDINDTFGSLIRAIRPPRPALGGEVHIQLAGRLK